MSSGTRKRSRFQTATKRRVQAMTWQEFDQWVELSEMLSFRTYAELTLWGEVYCSEPRSGWVGGGYPARPRDTLDLAYGIMKDPDAKLEVWDDSAKEMVERELPHLGVLAGGGR